MAEGSARLKAKLFGTQRSQKDRQALAVSSRLTEQAMRWGWNKLTDGLTYNEFTDPSTSENRKLWWAGLGASVALPVLGALSVMNARKLGNAGRAIGRGIRQTVKEDAAFVGWRVEEARAFAGRITAQGSFGPRMELASEMAGSGRALSRLKEASTVGSNKLNGIFKMSDASGPGRWREGGLEPLEIHTDRVWDAEIPALANQARALEERLLKKPPVVANVIDHLPGEQRVELYRKIMDTMDDPTLGKIFLLRKIALNGTDKEQLKEVRKHLRWAKFKGLIRWKSGAKEETETAWNHARYLLRRLEGKATTNDAPHIDDGTPCF